MSLNTTKNVGLEVSIIIPSYNPDSLLLQRAVDSCYLFGDALFEILVVDDCSRGKQDEWYQSLASPRYEKVNLIYSSRNLGPGGARNVALSNLVNHNHNHYITFLDSDDEFLPAVKQLSDTLMDEPELDVVTFGYIKNKGMKGLSSVTRPSGWIRETFTRLSAMLVRADVITNERFVVARVGEDTEFILRLILKYNWRHYPIALCKYNHRGNRHINDEVHPLLRKKINYDDITDKMKIDDYRRLLEFVEYKEVYYSLRYNKKIDPNIKHNISALTFVKNLVIDIFFRVKYEAIARSARQQ